MPHTRRRRQSYETPEFVGMLRRLVRSLGRRLADGDPSDLALAVELHRELDAVIRESVRGMREQHGYSWAEIAAELNMTRQGCQQRYGKG